MDDTRVDLGEDDTGAGGTTDAIDHVAAVEAWEGDRFAALVWRGTRVGGMVDVDADLVGLAREDRGGDGFERRAPREELVLQRCSWAAHFPHGKGFSWTWCVAAPVPPVL